MGGGTVPPQSCLLPASVACFHHLMDPLFQPATSFHVSLRLATIC